MVLILCKIANFLIGLLKGPDNLGKKIFMNDLSLSPDRKVPTMADIQNLAEVFAKAPQVEMPVKHHHSDGIYIREIFMPAGTVVVGKKHATRHLNIILEGECIIWTVHGKIHGRTGMT